MESEFELGTSINLLYDIFTTTKIKYFDGCQDGESPSRKISENERV